MKQFEMQRLLKGTWVKTTTGHYGMVTGFGKSKSGHVVDCPWNDDLNEFVLLAGLDTYRRYSDLVSIVEVDLTPTEIASALMTRDKVR